MWERDIANKNKIKYKRVYSTSKRREIVTGTGEKGKLIIPKTSKLKTLLQLCAASDQYGIKTLSMTKTPNSPKRMER